MIEKTKKVNPALVAISVTSICNNKCVYCYSDSQNVGEHIPMERFIEMVNIIKRDTTIRRINLTGGEPTLHPKIFQIIDYVLSTGLNIAVLSNGRKFSDKDFCEKFVHSGVESLLISFESADKKIYTIQAGNPNAFEEATKGIQNLVKLSPSGFRFFVNITLTNINKNSILDTIKFLINLGVEEITINPCITSGRGKSKKELIMKKSEIAEILYSAKLLCENYGIKFTALHTMPWCIIDPNMLGIHDYSCIAGKHFCIHTNGDVAVCDFLLDEIIGNIFENSLVELWDHPKMVWYRKRLYAPPKCRECENLEKCGSLCPALARGIGVKEIIETKSPTF